MGKKGKRYSFLIPGKNTALLYGSIAVGILVGIVFGACLLIYFHRRKPSITLPSGLNLEKLFCFYIDSFVYVKLYCHL